MAGEASAAYVLGVSGAVGNEMRTLALARVGGERRLYEAAFADLWASFEAAEGPAVGRRLALVNVRYDADALNLVLYTEARVAIRADVVEFE